jgi:hypothetical protein
MRERTKMMWRSVAVLSAAAVLALPVRLLAHEGHVHKVMGTVAAVDATHIEVDTKDGKKESYPLTKDTNYLKGKAAATAGDVKLGARVVLSVVEKEGKKSVTELLMAAGAKQEQHEHKH